MPKSYRVQFVCPHMDHSEWVIMENVYLSPAGVANTFWEFICPTHGEQRRMPLQVQEKSEILPPTLECAIEGCATRTLGVLEGRPFCRDHFLAVCQKRLDVYRLRFSEQRWRDVTLDGLSHFVQECMREADRAGLDKVGRARLFGILLSAADLGRHLRRSPRKLLSIPVRLFADQRSSGWKEDTETVLVSRCGALVRSHHSARIGDELEVMRLDQLRQARVRVAWQPGEATAQGRPAPPFLALEFVEADNFWGLDWPAIERQLGPLGDHFPLH